MGMGFNRLGALGIFTGLLGLAYGYFQMKNTKKISDKLGVSIEEMSHKVPVDIEKAILDRAIQTAVDREVRTSVMSTSQDLNRTIRKDMDEKIREDVNSVYEDLKGSVHDHVHSEVSKIDIDALKSDIRQEVKDEVFKKVCDLGGLANLFGGKPTYQGYRGLDASGIKDILDMFPTWERQEALERLTDRR